MQFSGARDTVGGDPALFRDASGCVSPLPDALVASSRCLSGLRRPEKGGAPMTGLRVDRTTHKGLRGMAGPRSGRSFHANGSNPCPGFGNAGKPALTGFLTKL